MLILVFLQYHLKGQLKSRLKVRERGVAVDLVIVVTDLTGQTDQTDAAAGLVNVAEEADHATANVVAHVTVVVVRMVERMVW